MCYQGMAEDLAQVVKLDPFACQPPHEARLVPYQWFDTDPCYDSGFGIPLVSAGHPYAPPVAQFRHHCLSVSLIRWSACLPPCISRCMR